MKAVNIIALSITVIFIAVIIHYVDACATARYYDWSAMDYSDNIDWDAWEAQRQAPLITKEAGFVSLFFFLFYIYLNIANMLKVKTVTTKVLGIIGISFTGLIFLWNLLMISSPNSISFDEVSGGWAVYVAIMLAFSIVFLVQSYKKTGDYKEDSEVLDDIV